MEHLKDYDIKTLHRDPDGELRTTKLHFYQAFLIKKLGLANTRAFDFAEAVQKLHLALCRCDYHNLDRLMTAYPGIADLVQDFARLEECAILYNHEGEEYK
jgi:hypothetical protein